MNTLSNLNDNNNNHNYINQNKYKTNTLDNKNILEKNNINEIEIQCYPGQRRPRKLNGSINQEPIISENIAFSKPSTAQSNISFKNKNLCTDILTINEYKNKEKIIKDSIKKKEIIHKTNNTKINHFNSYNKKRPNNLVKYGGLFIKNKKKIIYNIDNMKKNIFIDNKSKIKNQKSNSNSNNNTNSKYLHYKKQYKKINELISKSINNNKNNIKKEISKCKTNKSLYKIEPIKSVNSICSNKKFFSLTNNSSKKERSFKRRIGKNQSPIINKFKYQEINRKIISKINNIYNHNNSGDTLENKSKNISKKNESQKKANNLKIFKKFNTSIKDLKFFSPKNKNNKKLYKNLLFH